MGFYVLINSSGIKVLTSEKMLTLRKMQSLVGTNGEPAYIEIASCRSYSDNTIRMICDDDFVRKGYDPTCYTAEGYLLHGQVLVLGNDRAKGDFSLLTQEQIEIVKRETMLFV